MRFSVLGTNERNLARSAALIIVSGLAAGCSSQVARFGGGIDDIFTSSTANQRQIINHDSQPYPGDQVAAAPTGSVNRSAVSPASVGAQPVARNTLPPVESRPLPAPEPVVASAPAEKPKPKLKPAPAPESTATLKAPDSTAKVAEAKSPSKSGAPADKVPAAAEKLAVLPQQPKVKSSDTASQATASADTKAKPEGGAGSYVVQSGDSLAKIARKTGVGVASIKAANGMQDGLIRVGQTLKIPGGEASSNVASASPVKVDPVVTGTAAPAKPVKAGSETVVAYTPPKKSEKLIQQAEQDTAAAPDATGIGRMRWPVRGRVISGYGKGTDGIDIAVPEGTPVKAAENGVVIYAGDGLKEFGNTVLVRHEDGLVTVYGHASELKVSRGQKVKRGDEIALSGMSGSTNAPKLHFEVRKNSAPVDPSTYLE